MLPNRFYNDVDNIPIWDKQNIIALNDILDKSLIILNQYRNFNITEESTFQSINDTLKTYDESIKKSIKALNLNNTKNSIKAIEDYKNTLLNSENSIQKQIADSHAQIQAFNNAFSAKKAEIEKARNETIAISQQAQDKFSEFEETKQNINALEREIENKQNELDKYDKEQKDTIEALKQGIENLLDSATLKIEEKNKEINNLLATATDASLASSYAEAKNSYKWSIWIWNGVFIVSMAVIAVIAWGSVFGISFFNIQPADFNDYKSMLNLIFLRLPLYIPLAWLAIFATRRRNEIKRLQEEYRHKEAAAKSYFGYRNQIQNIEKDKDKKELMEKLMEKLVEMTNENPNKSLNKTSKENIPMIDCFEKFAKSPEEARNLFKEFMSMLIKKVQTNSFSIFQQGLKGEMLGKLAKIPPLDA